MASSPRINTQLERQTLELRRKARLPVHRPSACSGVKALRNTSDARRQAAKLCYRFGPLTPSARSGDLIAGDGTKNGLSRSEQKTLSTTQNNRLTGKAPYKSTANLTSGGAAGQHNAMIAARYHTAWKLCAKLRRAMVKTLSRKRGRWRNRAAVARPEILPVAVSDPPSPTQVTQAEIEPSPTKNRMRRPYRSLTIGS